MAEEVVHHIAVEGAVHTILVQEGLHIAEEVVRRIVVLILRVSITLWTAYWIQRDLS